MEFLLSVTQTLTRGGNRPTDHHEMQRPPHTCGASSEPARAARAHPARREQHRDAMRAAP